MEIIPAILEKDWNEIERKINLVSSFVKTASNAAPAVHIDIIDGKFAPDTTFLDPMPFKKYSDKVFLELHMMVEDPINYLKPFADCGFKRFLGHIESMLDQAEFVAQGQLLGEVGLAIDGPTDLSAIKVPYGDLDCLLIMTIKAGASGQEFTAEYLAKAQRIRQENKAIPIEIDGGVNDQTIALAKNAGATRFCANSFLFKKDNPYKQYQILKEKLKGGEKNG